MKTRLLFYITLIFIILTCDNSSTEPEKSTFGDRDFRKNMRNFVQDLSDYAKNIDDDFLIIPQNGHSIISDDDEISDSLHLEYFLAIDGIGREDLFYGYDDDDKATSTGIIEEFTAFLNIYEDNNLEVLVTDYTDTPSKIDNSYSQNESRGYISFAATRRDLNNIPAYPESPYNENSDNISNLSDVQNFLYILDPGNDQFFSDRNDYLNSIQATNYDLFIIDAYYSDDILTQDEVQNLKQKSNGADRLVIAYMSIGEAEDYRNYWQKSWNTNLPEWIEAENPNWPGNYKVRYWEQDWQDIFFGNDDSYLKDILNCGFNGVYLDIIDAYEYFED